MTSFDAFIAQCWEDHGDRPEEVADRLTASVHLATEAAHIPPFAQIATHVFGEHLGQWPRGVEFLESLRRLPSYDGEKVSRPIDRGIAVLRYAGGANDAMDALTLEDRVAASSIASGAFLGRKEFGRAIAAYDQALQLASAGLPSGSPAIGSLAVGGNNLAAALEEKQDRDPAETAAMVSAAEAGLTYWKQAGTWLQEERAEYRLARSLLQAGRSDAARESARRCVEICERNDAPVFERFFGQVVLALAHRGAGDAADFEGACQRARQLYEQVPADERQWCESDLRELGA